MTNKIILLQLHKKKILILTGFFLISSAVAAQVELKGTVTDTAHNPIGFVNVELKSAGEASINNISDSLGHFSFKNIKPQTYSLVYSFLKKTSSLDIVVTADTSITIALDIAEKSLATVTVSARRPLIERKVDRLVFNVDNSVAAIGGDALDILKITPGVKVSDDQLQIIGKSSLKVMVNGKFVQLTGDNLIAYLRSLPTAGIQSIEVITTPPAKYEAEGNSGLINIVLKPTKKNSWNASVRGSLTQNSLLGYADGARFDYQKNKLSVFGDFGNAEYVRTNTFDNQIFYPGQTWLSNRTIESRFHTSYGRAGVDYAITPKWSVGAQYEGNINKSALDNRSLTSILNGAQAIDSFIQSKGNTRSHSNDNSYNVHSIVKLDSAGKKLSIDLDHYTSTGSTAGSLEGMNLYPSKTEIGNSGFGNANSNNNQIKNYSALVDLEWPTSWATLNFGGKISSNTVTNDYQYSGVGANLDTNQNNLYRYQENKQALYFSGTRKFGSKIEVQAGLRAENTRTNGYSRDSDSTYTNQYLKFFPTAYFTYHLADNKSLSATYSKRLDRPGFEMLDPYKIYLNSQTTSKGNPYLQPAYTDNLELVYNYGNNETKLYYSYTTQGYDQIAYISAIDNTTAYTYENYLHLTTYGLEQSYTFSAAAWWTSTNSVNLNYSLNRSTNPVTVQKADAFTGYFSTSNDLVLNAKKTFLFNVGYWYNLPQVSGVNHLAAMSSLSSSVKVLLFSKSMTLGLSASDILRTQVSKYKYSSNNIQVQTNNYYDARQVRLSLSYKFGNKNISVKKRDFGNQEDRDRK